LHQNWGFLFVFKQRTPGLVLTTKLLASNTQLMDRATGSFLKRRHSTE